MEGMEQLTPELEAKYEAMSPQELEAHVDGENSAPAQQATENTQETSEQTQPEAQPEDAPPAWFQKYSENMKRELGSLRSLQSLGDKLPQLVQKQVAEAIARIQQNQNLSPEDRESQAQLQTQQDALAKFVREQARAEFGEAGKEYLQLLDELKEQKQDMGHKNSVLDLVKDVIPEKSDEVWNKVFEQSYKDIMEGKPGAIERQDRLEKDPAFVALAMIQAQRSQIQTQANQVSQQRNNAAKAAAQTVKPNAAIQSGKKSVADMSETEMMEFAEKDPAAFEAAIPEQAR